MVFILIPSRIPLDDPPATGGPQIAESKANCASKEPRALF